MAFKVKIDMKKGWVQSLERGMKAGLLEMATDIQRVAADRAPIDSGALRNSGTVEPVRNGYRIRFGSARVPYARRRHYENRKNPSTLGYLAKAGDNVARSDTSRYFRRKVDV